VRDALYGNLRRGSAHRSLTGARFHSTIVIAHRIVFQAPA
jgi:hypothetical protein